MHEFGIAQSLLEIVEKEALSYKGAKVKRITVQIGNLTGVMPDALRFAFEALRTGGIAEESSLEIEEIPLRIQCHQCGATSILEDPFLICPYCEDIDVEILAGRELQIQNMEIEDGS
jgi:hydrogenase nickel incorporation protein HypA/HybF